MRRSTTWRRRRAMGAGLLAALALSVVPAGARAGEDFVAGSGRARASIFEIVPRTGGLALPVSFGRAAAAYQGTAADASSTAIRIPDEGSPPAPPGVRGVPEIPGVRGVPEIPGVRGVPEMAADCGGRNPGGGGGGGAPGGGGGAPGGGAPSPMQNPFISTLRVTSEDKDSEAGRRASSLATPAGSPVQAAGAEQEVSATDDPASRATTVEGRFGVGELLAYTQARAEAQVGVVEGKARLASATVTLDRLDLLGGTVALERLRWEAVQRTGEGPRAEGGFSVGRITVAGTAVSPIPGEGGDDVFGPLNTALEPTGVAFDAPRVEKDAGVVRVSPLTVRFSDSPVGRATLGPVLGALQPVRDPLVEQLLDVSCDVGTALTVADVVASIASGSGGVSFDVGGASATTEGTRYDNPFDGPLGDPFGAVTPPPLPEAAVHFPAEELLAAPPPADDSFLPFAEYIPAPLATVAPAPETQSEAPVALAQPVTGPSSRRLAGSRGGAALVAGAIGLLAVLALAAADARHLRRAARSVA